MERLHDQYDRINILPKFSVTLLTNYRCHSGILMLPSSLYYHSTLQCRVPDDSSHPLAPFPLTFICTDVKHDNWKSSGVNEHEAEAVIQSVKKYCSKWPKNWRDKDKNVCIMSPSADQVYLHALSLDRLSILCSIQLHIVSPYKTEGFQIKD